jgi:hypothetical protein
LIALIRHRPHASRNARDSDGGRPRPSTCPSSPSPPPPSFYGCSTTLVYPSTRLSNFSYAVGA